MIQTELPLIPNAVRCSHLGIDKHAAMPYRCLKGLHDGVCTEAPDTMSSCSSYHDYAKQRNGRPGKVKTTPTPAKAAAVPTKPCGYLGEPTGETIVCPSCKGHVELKTFRCGVYETCTVGKEAPRVACCVGCTHHTHGDTPLIPERIIKVDMPHVDRQDGHGDHYNCSIIEWRGKVLMASRLGWAGSSVWLSELDAEYQVIPGTLRGLGIRHPNAYSGVEDPRLFAFRGQLHLAVTGYDAEQKGGTSLFISALDDKLNVERVWMPKYDKRRHWEKNWQPFVHDDALHFVYEIAPHHLVLRQQEDQTVTEVSRTKHDFGWPAVQLRGGAAPLKVGAEFWSFFHTFGSNSRGLTTWAMGLYTFAASPPFQLLRRVPYILLEADDMPKESNRNILYPCGAILRDGKFVVSYGQQDRECRVAVFDRHGLEGRLR